MPEVFYITYDFINYGLSSWTDQLEYIIENSKEGDISTPIGKIKFNKTINSKIKTLIKIRKKLKTTKKIDTYIFTKFIAKKLNFNKEFQVLNFSIFKKMSWNHVKKINKQKLFTIGGH